MTQVVDEDVVILDAAVGIAVNTIQHLDDRDDPDRQAGFLLDLSNDGRLERLPQFHGPTGQAPFALQRRIPPFDEDDAIAMDDDGPDADHRTIGKRPHYSPITLMTTRFF